MKHHYIPVFYLKRWAGPDRKVCEFSNPYNGVVPRRVHPEGTGYLTDLYRLPGLDREGEHALERLFFSPVDSEAADAMAKMHNGETQAWTIKERSAWTRFLTSLLFRNPDDVSKLITTMRKEFFETDDKSEAAYRARKRENDPPTLVEFLRLNADQNYVDRGSFKTLKNLIDLAETGSFINEMNWSVIDTNPTGDYLFTSDRPVLMTNGINKPNSFLLLPIGIDKIFVATNERAMTQYLSRNLGNLVKSVNMTTVCFASRYVWARNDSASLFVKSRMGSQKGQSMIDKIVNHKNAFRRAYELRS